MLSLKSLTFESALHFVSMINDGMFLLQDYELHKLFNCSLSIFNKRILLLLLFAAQKNCLSQTKASHITVGVGLHKRILATSMSGLQLMHIRKTRWLNLNINWLNYS